MPRPWLDGATRVFHPVFNEQGGTFDDKLEYSLLYNMIRLGKENQLSPHAPVPDHIQTPGVPVPEAK